MGILDRFRRKKLAVADATKERAVEQSGALAGPSSERGVRSTPEAQTRQIYRTMWVDPDLRQAILDIRHMDRIDPRVKKIHGRMVRTAIKGGVLLDAPSSSKRLHRQWQAFRSRVGLHRPAKLESDGRGLVMEGNLPMQWVLGPNERVMQAVRMPSETLVPRVGQNGRFENPREAYDQYDVLNGRRITTFGLWQLSLVRLTPDNEDDFGCLGRPYLDASRVPWKKLLMTEEDLVVRRRTRAPQRMAHVLEGATKDELTEYRDRVESEIQDGNYRDYFMNRKGGVAAVGGDAQLDQIADVVHLLDTFFAGAPAPKGLFGYTTDLARDILEDLKRDYFDEIDALQDTLAWVYELGFRLDLLLAGENPDREPWGVKFAERRTETPNQATDRALKQQALGSSRETYLRTAGLDPGKERSQIEQERRDGDPYPGPSQIGAAGARPRVSITPGNARKGDSATAIGA